MDASFGRTYETIDNIPQLPLYEVVDGVQAVVEAIGDMIRAQGSSGISRKTNLDRASLYRSFSGQMSPGFERVAEVLLAMDVELVARPVRPNPADLPEIGISNANTGKSRHDADARKSRAG